MSERTPDQDEAFKLHYNFKTLNDKVAEYTALLTERENLKKRLEKEEKKTPATPIWNQRLNEIETKIESALSLAVQAKKDLKELLCGEVVSCCEEKKIARKKKTAS